MSLFAIALLMFAEPVEIDLDNPRCIETDLVLLVAGEEVVAKQLSCRTVDRQYVTIAIKYPELHDCPLGLPCGETIWSNDVFHDVDRLENFLRDRYHDYYIGLPSLRNIDVN